jgi:hypothetical protein
MIPTPPRLRLAASDLERIARDMSPTDAQWLCETAKKLHEMADGEENRQQMRVDVAGVDVRVPKREERKE